MATSVLVVDDSPIARRILIRAFPKDWEAEIRQVGDGVQALDAYRDRRPEIIFLDLNMPVLDGYGVLEALQGLGPLPPIIVLTGDIQPKAEERVLALGAFAFVKKPVAEDTIAELLKKCGIH